MKKHNQRSALQKEVWRDELKELYITEKADRLSERICQKMQAVYPSSESQSFSCMDEEDILQYGNNVQMILLYLQLLYILYLRIKE